MHLHILGICGSFMGGVAALARAAGHEVTGSDENVYPPMSDQLRALGIELHRGYDPAQLDNKPDVVVIGNALSRGNPCIERVLNDDMAYISGPQWLAVNVLNERHVIAIAGTHGKTTTTSMLAFILERAGHEPGFLIGGVAPDLEISAKKGNGRCFVVEADEYDTAFYDKRSKFIHYRPRTLVLNNLEFDHADIFPDLESIKRQFHHLVRTVPANGRIICNTADESLRDVLAEGCWTPIEHFGEKTEAEWSVLPHEKDASRFSVSYLRNHVGTIEWKLVGEHNMLNGLAAVAAAHHVGVAPEKAVELLAGFSGVRGRLELIGEQSGIRVYDDFAHHPTAIRLTLQAARHAASGNVIAVLEPRSNTMRMGTHTAELEAALNVADRVFLYQPPNLGWNLGVLTTAMKDKARVLGELDALVEQLADAAGTGDDVIIMSNGGFGNLPERLLKLLAERQK
ncbi:MAG: UDP-N-acetylmuramate:L-alanyl-gamma-D-glutamyl-meso-diaminopimelate ligase [Gammaproteobacteria bacterium]